MQHSPALDPDAVGDAFRAKFGHLPPWPQGFGLEACAEHWQACIDADDDKLDPYAHYPEGATP